MEAGRGEGRVTGWLHQRLSGRAARAGNSQWMSSSRRPLLTRMAYQISSGILRWELLEGAKRSAINMIRKVPRVCRVTLNLPSTFRNRRITLCEAHHTFLKDCILKPVLCSCNTRKSLCYHFQSSRNSFKL